MAARRDKVPPFEIMGRPGRDQAEPPPAEPVRQHEEEPIARGGGGSEFEQRWWQWSGAGVPIILRVPRGMAAIVLAGVLGLIVLAYWVGYSRGAAATEARLAADELEMRNPSLRQAPPPIDLGQRDTTAKQPQTAAQTRDPRQVGLNYLVLALYPKDEAHRLAEFLRGEGVETVLDPVDNGRSVHVVAVNRGFTRTDLGTDESQAYIRQMQAAGRAWKRHNKNRGDALETMYFEKYTAK